MTPVSEVKPKQRTGRPRKHRDAEREATILYKPTVLAFAQAVAKGQAREIMCVGTRGDGKTQGMFGAMLMHAAEHARLGYQLPVKWIGVTDTFASHKLKTIPSLEDPMWKGAWRMSDGGHLVIAKVNGQEIVHLHLFGIEDQGAMDRVRMECHGVWFEEPAPAAVLVSSSGVTEMAWTMAMTSQRLPTHAHVAAMTLNYPDEDHWTWQRFQPQPGVSGVNPTDATRAWFRIPPGERASKEQRESWAHALRDRPDLLRRLVEGQPGSILLGPQVADGFRRELHVAKERIFPVKGEPLALGVDFGLTPSVIVGQHAHGYRRVYAAFPCQRGGIKQLMENDVIPWIDKYAPWALQQSQMIYGCYDPAGQTAEESDIERNPVGTLEKILPGLWFPGPIKWESRKHTLLSAINHHRAPGQVSLQLDPVHCKPLIEALDGRWHYPMDRLGAVRRDGPKKPHHPWEDLGDALIYWLWGLTTDAQPPAEIKVESQFEIGQRQPQAVEVESTWRM